MNENFVNLVGSTDSQGYAVSPFGHVVYPAAQPVLLNPMPTVGVAEKCEECGKQITLAEFSEELFGERFVDSSDALKKSIWFIISELKKLDEKNADQYSIYLSGSCGYADIRVESIFNANEKRLFRTIQANISLDPLNKRCPVRIGIGSLYVNIKYEKVGSLILRIMKEAVQMLVNLSGVSGGTVELYSVETAVMFYIKNGFVIRSILYQDDPQQDYCNAQRMIEFAIKENNLDIVKKVAKVTVDNFIDLINQLIKETKYGKFFTTYFNEKPKSKEIDKSIMQSKFISSLFQSSMVQQYKKPRDEKKIDVKILSY